MEFKVGDTVKILDRVGDKDSYTTIYTDYMLKYAGTLTTISAITSGGSLKLYNNEFYWDKKAVKLVNEDKYLHPSELKEGDYIRICLRGESEGYIYIFKEYVNDVISRYVSYDVCTGETNTDVHIEWGRYVNTVITYATPEEKKLLDDELLKKGYVWDNVNKKLLEVSSLNITNETGVVAISQEHYLSDWINRVNPTHIPSHPKYGVFVDTDKKELNLFPTKKHYQLNFNY